jgi:hypothetical protein
MAGEKQNLSVSSLADLAGLYTGGETGKYEALADQDICLVMDPTTGELIPFILDIDSGLTHNGSTIIAPSEISPGVSYTGDARFIRMKVRASGTGTIDLTAAGGLPSLTNGASGPNSNNFSSNAVDLFSLDFDPSTEQYAQWCFVMPSDWDGGTITARFVWLADDATTNAVIWGVQGRAYGDGDAIDQAWGTAQEVSDANGGTANQVRISGASSAMTFAGTPAASEVVAVRVYRKAADAGDSLSVSAALLHVLLTYTKR